MQHATLKHEGLLGAHCEAAAGVASDKFGGSAGPALRLHEKATAGALKVPPWDIASLNPSLQHRGPVQMKCYASLDIQADRHHQVIFAMLHAIQARQC